MTVSFNYFYAEKIEFDFGKHFMNDNYVVFVITLLVFETDV